MTAFTRTAGCVVAGALLLAACGSDSEEPARTGEFNDADVAFAQMMIPHHEQALDMARLADGRASDTEIKNLAGQIEQAQDPEIRTMKGWLESWKQPTTAESVPGMDHGSDHGSGDSGAGMMSDADMEELKALKGTEFDKFFAAMMIEHHNGAIDMAEDERTNGENADAREMAGDIVKSQSAEVEQLQDILDRLS